MLKCKYKLKCKFHVYKYYYFFFTKYCFPEWRCAHICVRSLEHCMLCMDVSMLLPWTRTFFWLSFKVLVLIHGVVWTLDCNYGACSCHLAHACIGAYSYEICKGLGSSSSSEALHWNFPYTLTLDELEHVSWRYLLHKCCFWSVVATLYAPYLVITSQQVHLLMELQ